MHFTSRKPSVKFVQGATLEILINSDLSFEQNLEQKIAENCLLEGRDVFAVMPTSFGKNFFFRLFSTAIKQKPGTEELQEVLRRQVSEQCDSSYLPIDRPD